MSGGEYLIETTAISGLRPGYPLTPPLNTSHLLFIQRFTHALRNDGLDRRLSQNVTVRVKAGRGPRYEHAKPAFEGVSSDPGFMRSLGMLAARDDGRFNALATVAREPFDVEDRDGHTAQL